MGLAVQLLDACERDPDAQPAPARRVCLFASAAAARVVLGGVQGTSYCRIRSVLRFVPTMDGLQYTHLMVRLRMYTLVVLTLCHRRKALLEYPPHAARQHCWAPCTLPCCGTRWQRLLCDAVPHGAVWSQAACRMGACRVLPAMSVDVVALPTVAAHSEWQCGRLRQKELHVYSAGAVSGSEVPAHSSAWRA